MGTLYVVGTPIGNLEDLTRRAARILGQVGLIAAEDTRVTRRLLNHLGLRVPLISCNRHNWPARLPELLRALESGDAALVTDAGMPAVSDPGSEVTAQVAAAGFPVEVIPGASAVTAALAAAGMPADSFLFLGFLPRRRKDRRARLAAAAPLPFTLVIFEAPHRLRPTLEDLLATLGDRNIAVCRELTKLHEEVRRSSIAQARDYFTAPRGEFVLVVAGTGTETGKQAGPALETGPETMLGTGLERMLGTAPTPAGRPAAQAQLAQLRREGKRGREAVARVVAATGLSRREVYRLWVETAETNTPSPQPAPQPADSG